MLLSTCIPWLDPRYVVEQALHREDYLSDDGTIRNGG